MAKRSFLIPVALSVAALAGSTGTASAIRAPSAVTAASEPKLGSYTSVDGMVLERANGPAMRLADHVSHESHASHESHSSHSSHSSGSF